MKSTSTAPQHRRPAQLTLSKKLLFSAIVAVAVLGVVECLLWAVGTETVLQLEDPFRGFSGLVKVFEAEEDRYTTRSSNLATFNEQSFLKQKPKEGLRVFCLGGSSSYGFPWGAESAFTSIVGELLAASHPDRNVEAVNVSGVSYAMHRLNIIADELLAYDPDVFIIYSGHNEFIEPVFMKALKERSTVRTRVEYVAAHSRIYSGLWSLVHRQPEKSPSMGGLSATVLRDHGIFSPSQKAEVVAEYRQRLDRLVRIAQAAGVDVVLCTVPCNEREWSPEASGNVASLSGEDRQAWSEGFAVGKGQLENGKPELAVTRLEQAARLAPMHAETQYYLGKAYDALGRWDDARQAYRSAVDADASPIRRLSGINEAIRDVAAERNTLLVDADRVFERESEHGLVGFNLIKDYVHPTREGHELIAWHIWEAIERSGWMGSKATADRAIYEQVLAARPRESSGDKAVWFFNQGVLLEKQGQDNAAMQNYEEALKIRADYVPAMSNLGALLAKVGRPNDAIQILEHAVSLDPNQPNVHNNLGGALKMVGRLEEALRHFQSELELTGTEQAGVQLNMGITLQALGRPKEAVQRYQQVLRIEPDSFDAHMYWGSLLLQQNQVEQAVMHFERAVEFAPDLAHGYSNLGVALLRQKRFAEAAGNFEKAIQISPDYAVAHKNLGLALAEQGKLSAAVRHFEQALRLQPDLPGVRDKLQRAMTLIRQHRSP